MRDHFIEIDDIRLHWAEIGDVSAAPPVVLLHGLNNSCRSWSRVALLVAADRRVLMPDLPGHGQSDRPNAGYELDWYRTPRGGRLVIAGDLVDFMGMAVSGAPDEIVTELNDEELRHGLGGLDWVRARFDSHGPASGIAAQRELPSAASRCAVRLRSSIPVLARLTSKVRASRRH